MIKSAREVLQEAMFSSLVESLSALRKNNVDNAVLREMKAIHTNTTFNDLPEAVKRAIKDSTDATLNRLAAEGYTVASKP